MPVKILTGQLIGLGCKDTGLRGEFIAEITSNCQNLRMILMQTFDDFPGTFPVIDVFT